MFFTTLVDYQPASWSRASGACRGFSRPSGVGSLSVRQRRWALIVSICINLTLLGTSYLLRPAERECHPRPVRGAVTVYNIVLPVGSPLPFQSMSHATTYRARPDRRDLRTFPATSPCSRTVAGLILRYRDLAERTRSSLTSKVLARHRVPASDGQEGAAGQPMGGGGRRLFAPGILSGTTPVRGDGLLGRSI
jgi:hypothetical protein